MEINLMCKPSAVAKKDGKAPIIIDVYISKNDRPCLQTDLRCTPSNFKPEKTFKPDNFWKTLINNSEEFRDHKIAVLKELYNKVQNIQLQAIRERKKLTKAYVMKEFYKTEDDEVIEVEEKPKEPDFMYMFEGYIRLAEEGLRKTDKGKFYKPASIDRFRYIKNQLKEYQKKKLKLITFSGINQHFYNSLLNYLWDDKGHFDNAVGGTIKDLKAFLSWAKLTTEHKEDYFKKFGEEKDIVVIDPYQLNTLIDAEFSFESVKEFYKNTERENTLDRWIIATKEMLERTRDTLVIGCVTALRISDLLKLTEFNLVKSKNYKLSLTSTKTGKPILIDLPDFACKIIDKYKGKHNSLLPRISEQCFNDNLKILGQYLGWDKILIEYRRYKKFEPVSFVAPMSELLSSHIMRRTGITSLLLAGMPESEVRKISGHANDSKSFQKYVAYIEQFVNKHYKGAWKIIRSMGKGEEEEEEEIIMIAS